MPLVALSSRDGGSHKYVHSGLCLELSISKPGIRAWSLGSMEPEPTHQIWADGQGNLGPPAPGTAQIYVSVPLSPRPKQFLTHFIMTVPLSIHLRISHLGHQFRLISSLHIHILLWRMKASTCKFQALLGQDHLVMRMAHSQVQLPIPVEFHRDSHRLMMVFNG